MFPGISNTVSPDPRLPTAIAFHFGPKAGKSIDLKELPRFSELRVLIAYDAGIFGADAWPHVGKLKKLTILIVPNSKLDDKGLGELKGLENLEYLDLGFADITDDSISVFESLPRLKGVNVSGTRMTLFGVELLKGKLPNCIVVTERQPYHPRTPADWKREAMREYEQSVKSQTQRATEP
jgi:hypothetical protein